MTFYYVGRRFYSYQYLLANFKQQDFKKIIADCSWIVDFSDSDIKRILSEKPDYLRF